MSSLELVPFKEVDPVATPRQIYELLQDLETRYQLSMAMPEFVNNYGQTAEGAALRFNSILENMRQNLSFTAYAHMLGDEVIGSATVDGRLLPYRHRLMRGMYLGRMAVSGPSTSGWLAAPFQGLGYGKESLESRIKIAVEDRSSPGVWVSVENNNHRSIANVMSRRFQKVSDEPFWYAGVRYEDSSVYQYLA